MKDDKLLKPVTRFYILFLILFLPLYVNRTGYAKILESKWNMYIFVSVAYIVISVGCIIYNCIKDKNYIKKLKPNKTNLIILVFLLINILATIFSPYLKQYNLLIGVGRGEGLLLTSVYIIMYLLINRIEVLDKKLISYFSVGSILISLVCILQYFGFNPFNLYRNGIGTHNVSFMGTIGNIDFLSAIYTIYLPISIFAFLFFDNKWYENMLHLLSFMFGFFIISIINVLSGKVAFLAMTVVLLIFLIKNNKVFSRFLVLLSVFVLDLIIILVTNVTYHYSVEKLSFDWQFNKYTLLLSILFVVLLVFAFIINKKDFEIKNMKRIAKIYFCSIFGLAFVSLLFLYFVNINFSLLGEIHEILHGNLDDAFGTFRIFLWKRSIPMIADYPLIGTGPDTFAVRFMALYSSDVASIGKLTINDTAANIYLTNFINTGILGGIAYIIFICCKLFKGLKSKNIISYAILLAAFTYSIQSFFNLSVVFVTPLFYLVLALLNDCIINKKEL